MKWPLLIPALLTLSFATLEDSEKLPDERVQSTLIESVDKELVLKQEVWLEASVERVWEAYTTSEGWMAWAAPVTEVELATGGTIRTHYVPSAKIGDEGTNTLHILGFVPNELLVLKAEVSERWPEALQEDGDKFSNVIQFEEFGDGHCKVTSYGLGYLDKPAHKSLLDFFTKANEGLLEGLRRYLEKGEKADFGG